MQKYNMKFKRFSESSKSKGESKSASKRSMSKRSWSHKGSKILKKTVNLLETDERNHERIPSIAKLTRVNSNTLIRLKEKLTKDVVETPNLNNRETVTSTTISTSTHLEAYDNWVKKKNEMLQGMHEKKKILSEVKRTSSGGIEGKAISRISVTEERLSKLETKTKEIVHPRRSRYSKFSLRSIKSEKEKSNTSLNEWDKLKQVVYLAQKIEPLKLGKCRGHALEEPVNLTKYVIKPDPAFQARYRNVIKEADSRSSEIMIDCECSREKEDPARLPLYIRKILHEGKH